MSFFFDDINPTVAASVAEGASGMSEPAAPYEPDPMMRRETLELVRAYYRVSDAQTRRRLSNWSRRSPTRASSAADA